MGDKKGHKDGFSIRLLLLKVSKSSKLYLLQMKQNWHKKSQESDSHFQKSEKTVLSFVTMTFQLYMPNLNENLVFESFERSVRVCVSAAGIKSKNKITAEQAEIEGFGNHLISFFLCS